MLLTKGGSIIIPVSVIILAKNEENYIARCINSIRWADEVLVIDSGSTDKTKEVAALLGATVYEQEWLGFPGQRNKGAELAKHNWAFFMDADELVTPELATSIQSVLRGSPDARDAYSVDRRGDFLGVLLSNQARPSRRHNFIRLCNRLHSAYDVEMIVHEEVRFSGKSIPLDGMLLHWNGYSIDELIPLFNRHATTEAQVLNKNGVQANAFDILSRPVLRFLWSYLATGSWRLGTRGLMHAMLKASSDYMRYAKLWEMQNVTHTIHPPAELYEPPPGSVTPPVSPLSETGRG